MPILQVVLPAVNLQYGQNDKAIQISGREHLIENYKRVEQNYTDKDIPRPPHWGGYRLIPDMFEFWQGSPSRLHDRLCYRFVEDNWIITRISP